MSTTPEPPPVEGRTLGQRVARIAVWLGALGVAAIQGGKQLVSSSYADAKVKAEDVKRSRSRKASEVQDADA